MAFFKFRLPGQVSAPAGRRDPSPAQAESVDAIRRRARHRLIGATVLVLVGVIGFPQLFDTQPRPVAVDVPITIPDRNNVKPLAMPAPASTPVSPAQAPAAKPVPRQEPAPASKPAAEPAVVRKPAPVSAPVRPPARPAEKVEKAAKVEKATSATPAAKAAADDGSRARALLEGKASADTPAEAGRMVIQVGAFADMAKAREVRQKLEKAGLKTYMQVVDGRDGKRIRVRVGPFASKAEADKAVGRVRRLDLPASLLTL